MSVSARRHARDAAGMWALLLIAGLFGAIRNGTFDTHSLFAGVGAGAAMVNLITLRHLRREERRQQEQR